MKQILANRKCLDDSDSSEQYEEINSVISEQQP